MKKSLLFLFCIIFLVAFVLAQTSKIQIEGLKENFKPGENITLKVSLFDSENKLINVNVDLLIENAKKTTSIEKIIPSNKFVDLNISLPEFGYWEITAKYEKTQIKELFFVEMNELVKFNLEGDILMIKNVGNTRYTKTIQIVIGETLGSKDVDLDIGESISFRLIAPDGVYNVRVTDGKTTLTKSEVSLTGKAIGILDERLIGGSGITGGISPDEISEDYVNKSHSFVYIFLLVVFGATILLIIERTYRKKAR